jgi:hypothetical protein
VTDMSGMFQGAIFFDVSLSTFDTSQVTNMSNMFSAPVMRFNQPLDTFDMKKVTDNTDMFYGAKQFTFPKPTAKSTPTLSKQVALAHRYDSNNNSITPTPTPTPAHSISKQFTIAMNISINT